MEGEAQRGEEAKNRGGEGEQRERRGMGGWGIWLKGGGCEG